jgi:meiotically up-regulated gene 157 (Mug157) protein
MRVLIVFSLLLTLVASNKHPQNSIFPDKRPPPSQRLFNSTTINALIDDYTARMIDPDLAQLFSNCLPNTLDTTVASFTPSQGDSLPDSYIITGDINAQWLRDSMNQVLPYVQYADQDPMIAQLICGLTNRHARNILHDPYANAFNFNASGAGHQDDNRRPAMTPDVFEGKYELDSLASAIKLSYQYWTVTQDTKCFTQDSNWLSAMKLIVSTIAQQQQPTQGPKTSPYLFQRTTSAPTDSLMLGGVGNIGRSTGMSRSAFRPSDDSTLFPFLIPANAMTVVELRHLSEMLKTLSIKQVESRSEMLQLASGASSLADQIDAGLHKFGVVNVPHYAEGMSSQGSNTMFAYEVDGYGGQNLMDDAGIPSLLSLPYLGYVNVSDPIYQATRAFVLSSNNPYYFAGKAGAGVGGPHNGFSYVWPMAIITQALTSDDDKEIIQCLELLKSSSAGTGWIHESFDKDDVTIFTRPWFAWVNGLFGQLIIQLAEQRPHLIFKQHLQHLLSD